MRLLLTGSNGFIGARVAARARERGWEVVGVGRSAEPASAVAKYVRADLTQGFSLAQRVDAVLHCAALASPWAAPQAFWAANVTATRAVLDWARAHGTPPVAYVSSSSVFYTRSDQLGLTESSPIPPDEQQINVYSRTKLAGERLVRGYPGRWSALRPRAVIGAGDPVVLPRLVRAARSGVLPLFVRPDDTPVTCDLTDVDTTAEYLLRALERGADGDFNLTNGTPVALYPFLVDVLARLRIPAPTRRLPVGFAMALAGAVERASARFGGYREPPITQFGVSMFAWSKTFDVARTRTVLGEPAVGLDECVDRIVAWWGSR